MRIFAVLLLLSVSAPASAMPICGTGHRVTCVVDGDTFWLRGEKIRLAGIDAPEIEGRCAFERAKAQAATQRLAEILSEGRRSIKRRGTDAYQRTLASVKIAGRDVGMVLIREGHVRPWRGRRLP